MKKRNKKKFASKQKWSKQKVIQEIKRYKKNCSSQINKSWL